MRTVEEHLAAVLALVSPTCVVRVALDGALGHVLGAPVHATEQLPRWDCSAMDGYAVRYADVRGAQGTAPVELPVVADLAAGAEASRPLAPGTAARIMTGAPVPPGADAVVPVEHTDGGTDRVRIGTAPEPGAHVRRGGEDVAAGDLVLPGGALLTPVAVAAAAAVGCSHLDVHRRPRVAVLSTGSELVPPGSALRPGQIPDSNSHLLAAAVRAAGGTAVRVGAVRDEPAALAEALTALEAADGDAAVDLVVTSGGVSMGAYDVVKALLAGRSEVEFVTVAMQPGKPQALGRLAGGTPLLGLPGNPVSAHVSFEVFVRPALRRLRGLAPSVPHDLTAVVAEGWRSPAGREQYMPVRLDPRGGTPPTIRPAAARGAGSHLVAGLARADGLAVVPADTVEVPAGARLPVRLVPPVEALPTAPPPPHAAPQEDR